MNKRVAILACSLSAFPALALTPSEAFVAEARRLYPTPEYAGYTNSIVGKYAKPKAWENTHDGETGLNWVVIPSMFNVRDLGGWNGLNTGEAYRGSQLFGENPTNVAYETRSQLQRRRIRTDLDLRLPDEEKGASVPLDAIWIGVNRINVYVTAYTGAFSDYGTNAWRKILKVFCNDANYPIYFHCKAGADRTGTLAFLLQGLCGVNETDLAIDYELTSFSGIGDYRLRYGSPAPQFGRNVFKEMLDAVNTEPGEKLSDRFAAFVKRRFGLTDDDVAVIRRHLVARPEKPVALLPMPRKVAWGEGDNVFGSPVFRTDPSIEKEGYRLSVGDGGIVITSGGDAGRFYALQTLAQLKRRDGGYRRVEIEDAPAYAIRGIQVDDVRHFFGKEMMLKLLRTMSRVKLNYLMWHVADFQGWRLEVPELPELAEKGSVREGTPLHGAVMRTGAPESERFEMTGKAYGPFYYTVDDVKEILACAEENHVTIVPSFDFPGHFGGILAAHPEFTCHPERIWHKGPLPHMGGGEIMCVGNDEAVAFVEKLCDYFCRTFPGPFVNPNCDECPVSRWLDCPKCRVRMEKEGMKGVDELQPWLIRRMAKRIADRGKRIFLADEALAGDVPKSAVGLLWRPQRWRGKPDQHYPVKTAAEHIAAGHDVLPCDWDYTYFYCGQGLADDPFQYSHNNAEMPAGGGELTLRKAYSYMLGAGVPEAARKHVLGSIAYNWSEFTWYPADFEWKLWPRGFAMAEVTWTGDERPAFEDFLERARIWRNRFVRQGVNCAPVKDPEDFE